MSEREESDPWLAAFHAGKRSTLEACYREHAPRVLAAARRIVGDVDAETVTHEVFYRLLSSEKMRASFRGGNVGAWLAQVVTRSAIDDHRRRRREVRGVDDDVLGPSHEAHGSHDEIEAKMLVERFRADVLPPELAPLFEARFIRQLPQREAAAELGIPRSTLVYQEDRVRKLLESFLLGDGAS